MPLLKTVAFVHTLLAGHVVAARASLMRRWEMGTIRCSLPGL